MKKCKILVLNGGGAMGAIETHFLSMLPKEKQDLSDVDVVVGASIGGILTAAYATGKKFGEVDEVFHKRAKECFVKRCAAKINPIACPTYKSECLEKVVKDMVGINTLGDVNKVYPKLKVVIPSVNITDDIYVQFSNFTHEYDHVPLWKLAMMTSAAPTYYSGQEFEGKCYVDSGIIECDPLLTATTMVKKYLGIPFINQKVLMIGTGMDRDPTPMPTKRYNSFNLLDVATEVLSEYTCLSNKLFVKQVADGLGLGYWNFWNPVNVEGKLADYKSIPKWVAEADKHKDEFLRTWNEWMTN